ncbi:MAG: Hsp33 family molecular chaperone HslO, partial [Erysipelotrichaceae bacterium]|nr:Hsp33 family molecular chaperone HslO [Erysipelotrichaceae bacterium]
NVVFATALNEHVRINIINSREIVEQARIYHDLWPTSCAALGRTLSVSALMGLRQKDDEEVVTVTINGNGPIGTILCVSQSNGQVKGFCGDPHFYDKYPETGKLAVGKGVGTDGYLRVTKNLKLKQNYTSQVKLQSGEIGDDFAYYFSVSEQVPSIVSVGVLVGTDCRVKSAGAMIIELLPNHEEADIEYLESLKLRPISSVFAENGDPLDYLNSLFNDVQVLEEKKAFYHCDCSKERFMRNLLTLPQKDLEEIAQDPDIEIKCEFCDKVYHFDENDIRTVLNYVSYKR